MERSFQLKVLCITVCFLFTATVLAAAEPSTSASAAEQVNTGKKYFNDGQFEEALAAWNVALDEYRRTNDKGGQARVLQNKAEAYLSMGIPTRRSVAFNQRLKLAQAAGDEQLATQVASSLGTAYLLSNRTDEARTLLEKATAEERAAGRPASAAVAGNNLGSLLASEGDYDAAIPVYQQAVSDAQAAGNNGLAAKGSVNIARALVESKREKEALVELNRAAGQAKALPASHEKAFVLTSIGRLYLRLASKSRGCDGRIAAACVSGPERGRHRG